MTAQAETSRPETAAMRPRRMGHVNLWVSDIDRGMEFYNKVFGLEVTGTERGILGGFLGNGSTHHDVGMVEITHGEDRLGRDGQIQIPKTMGSDVGLFHYAWEFENEATLVDRFNRIREIGYDIVMTQDHRISHAFYVNDPDGNLLEFYADMVKDWWRYFHGGDMELITGNWQPGATAPLAEAQYDPAPKFRRVKDAPLNPLRITHMALVVADMTRSYDFYTDVVGLDTLYKAKDGSFAVLCGTLGQYNLALFQAAPGMKVGMHHFGLEMLSGAAIGESAVALKKLGLPVEREFDDTAKRSLFIRDRDGARVEFFVDRKANYDSWSKAPVELRPFLA